MADGNVRMSFEEFTQSMMGVIDRALETSRALENQQMRNSSTLAWAPQPVARIEGGSAMGTTKRRWI